MLLIRYLLLEGGEEDDEGDCGQTLGHLENLMNASYESGHLVEHAKVQGPVLVI